MDYTLVGCVLKLNNAVFERRGTGFQPALGRTNPAFPNKYNSIVLILNYPIMARSGIFQTKKEAEASSHEKIEMKK